MSNDPQAAPGAMPDISTDPDAMRRLAARLRAEAEKAGSLYFMRKLRRRAAAWEDKATLLEMQRKAQAAPTTDAPRKKKAPGGLQSGR